MSGGLGRGGADEEPVALAVADAAAFVGAFVAVCDKGKVWSLPDYVNIVKRPYPD